MQMVMGPMGPMVAPMGALPPGAMAAPQLTQMLVDAARGGRSSNVFFKTRICNKCAGWAAEGGGGGHSRGAGQARQRHMQPGALLSGGSISVRRLNFGHLLGSPCRNRLLQVAGGVVPLWRQVHVCSWRA